MGINHEAAVAIRPALEEAVLPVVVEEGAVRAVGAEAAVAEVAERPVVAVAEVGERPVVAVVVAEAARPVVVAAAVEVAERLVVAVAARVAVGEWAAVAERRAVAAARIPATRDVHLGSRNSLSL